MTKKTKDDQSVAPSPEDNAAAAVGGTEVTEGEAPKTENPQGDTEVKPSEEAPSTEDKVTEDPSGQSYNALRTKMNDQGIELNTLRKQNEELQSKLGELSPQHQEVSEELAAYKKWYEQYYPVLNNLWQDDALRAKIEEGGKPKPITQEDAEKIAERKLSEFKEQSNFERSVDSWIKDHPDVKGKVAQEMYSYLEKHDLNPTPEILEMAYVYCTKDKLKEIGVKEHEIQQKKVSNAMVGGGNAAAVGKDQKNPIDDLFVEPVSNFYPGAKL